VVRYPAGRPSPSPPQHGRGETLTTRGKGGRSRYGFRGGPGAAVFSGPTSVVRYPAGRPSPSPPEHGRGIDTDDECGGVGPCVRATQVGAGLLLRYDPPSDLRRPYPRQLGQSLMDGGRRGRNENVPVHAAGRWWEGGRVCGFV
jgi:hypothetical protein